MITTPPRLVPHRPQTPDESAQHLKLVGDATRVLLPLVAALGGALLGGFVGSTGGLLGIVVGVMMGALLGGLTGRALGITDERAVKRDKQLDDDIGVTSANLGVPFVVMPVPERQPGEAWQPDTWPPPPPTK